MMYMKCWKEYFVVKIALLALLAVQISTDLKTGSAQWQNALMLIQFS